MAAPPTQTTEFRAMLPRAGSHCWSAIRFIVSIEKVDNVVNAPKIPTKRKVLVVSAMSKPYLNIRYDASMQPTTLTMNVAQGNSVSTVR